MHFCISRNQYRALCAFQTRYRRCNRHHRHAVDYVSIPKRFVSSIAPTLGLFRRLTGDNSVLLVITFAIYACNCFRLFTVCEILWSYCMSYQPAYLCNRDRINYHISNTRCVTLKKPKYRDPNYSKTFGISQVNQIL